MMGTECAIAVTTKKVACSPAFASLCEAVYGWQAINKLNSHDDSIITSNTSHAIPQY